MSEALGLTSCSSGFVPESTLSHKPEAQYGLVPRRRHQGGENIKKPMLANQLFKHFSKEGFSAERSGAVFLLFSGCNPIGVDVVNGGFYLCACTQGKAYRHNIRDEVLTWKKCFYGFLLN